MSKQYILKLNEKEHKMFLTMVDALLKATGSAVLPMMAHAHHLLHTAEVVEIEPVAPTKLKAVRR